MSSSSRAYKNSLTNEKGTKIISEVSKILLWENIRKDCNEILTHNDGILVARFLTHTDMKVEEILNLPLTQLPNGEVSCGDVIYSPENLQDTQPWEWYRWPKLFVDNTKNSK